MNVLTWNMRLPIRPRSSTEASSWLGGWRTWSHDISDGLSWWTNPTNHFRTNSTRQALTTSVIFLDDRFHCVRNGNQIIVMVTMVTTHFYGTASIPSSASFSKLKIRQTRQRVRKLLYVHVLLRRHYWNWHMYTCQNVRLLVLLDTFLVRHQIFFGLVPAHRHESTWIWWSSRNSKNSTPR